MNAASPPPRPNAPAGEGAGAAQHAAEHQRPALPAAAPQPGQVHLAADLEQHQRGGGVEQLLELRQQGRVDQAEPAHAEHQAGDHRAIQLGQAARLHRHADHLRQQQAGADDRQRRQQPQLDSGGVLSHAGPPSGGQRRQFALDGLAGARHARPATRPARWRRCAAAPPGHRPWWASTAALSVRCSRSTRHKIGRRPWRCAGAATSRNGVSHCAFG